MARIDHESGSILRKALRKQYPLPHYALLYEVASGMGKTMNAYADAIAMSLFPSRGLDLEGFEIKIDRRDWLKELKNPDKAEHIAKYCHFWWLVISEEGIAKPEEVPAGWGLYVMDKNDTLQVVKRPKKLKAIHPDMPFIGAMLRRANEMAERERQRAAETINKDEFVQKARAQAEKEAERRYDQDLRLATRTHEALKREVDEFEKVSGIKITMWNGTRMGEAVNMLASMKDSRHFTRIEELAEQIEKQAADLRRDALQLKEVGTSLMAPAKLQT